MTSRGRESEDAPVREGVGCAAAPAEGEKKAVSHAWVDGCFDLFHYGHANLLRQARELSTIVTAGIHSVGEIHRNKGLCVMADDEREGMLRQCRFIDRVCTNAPFITNIATVRREGATVVIHGDDPVSDAGGNDCYREAKAQGMFREVARTYSVSTTSLIEKVLSSSPPLHAPERTVYLDHLLCHFRAYLPAAPLGGQPPASSIYIHGAFSVYLPALAHKIAAAKELYPEAVVLVGLVPDEEFAKHGERPPLMCERERELSLISHKAVDRLIYGIGLYPEEGTLRAQGVSQIVCTSAEDAGYLRKVLSIPKAPLGPTPFSYFDDAHLFDRILSNSADFSLRNLLREERPSGASPAPHEAAAHDPCS